MAYKPVENAPPAAKCQKDRVETPRLKAPFKYAKASKNKTKS